VGNLEGLDCQRDMDDDDDEDVGVGSCISLGKHTRMM
jgi:hypothetical protein